MGFQMSASNSFSASEHALSGVTVVALEQAVAAPLCSCRLAEAGARVIKIERQEGDFARGYDSAVNGESTYFVWLNKGKESVTIDIKSTQGQTLLHALIAKADVFIQNLAPGACTRLGIGSEQLRQRYPALITCDISGYGEHNSYETMKAYDLLIQAESGLVSVSGAPQQLGRIGVSLVDIAAGMNALAGIQQALYKKARSGVGSSVKVSLFDSAIDWMSVPLLQQKYTGVGPKPVGLMHPSIAPYGAFTTQDNKQLVISIQNNREWATLCEHILKLPALISAPEYATNNQRVAHRIELDALINEQFSKYSLTALSTQLKKHKIAFGSINSTADLMHHPLVRYTQVESAAGELDIIASPVIFDGERAKSKKVPSIGEHTQQITAEFLGRK